MLEDKYTFRRILRAQRMLSEMGYSDGLEALEDLARYRGKMGTGANCSTCGRMVFPEPEDTCSCCRGTRVMPNNSNAPGAPCPLCVT